MQITISGTPASGKSSVAKLLAKKLDYKHYSMGDFQRDLAKERGVDIVELGRIEAKSDELDRMVDEKQADLGKEQDNFVIDSWLGAHFIPSAIKIFIDADIDVRAKRRLSHKRKEEDYSNLEKVKEEMQKREAINKERWQRYYQFDYSDENNYDLTIDSSDIIVEQVVERIIDYLEGEHLNMKPDSTEQASSAKD